MCFSSCVAPLVYCSTWCHMPVFDPRVTNVDKWAGTSCACLQDLSSLSVLQSHAPFNCNPWFARLLSNLAQ
jgi:hypothetical protein